MQTFIFGHRNPDTDSVCASIALSYLFNQEGRDTVPKVLGHINMESTFVLDYFKVKCPDYLNDTKVQIEDINYNHDAYVNENDSIFYAFRFMQKEDITAVPLVNHEKELTGFVTLKELAKYLIGGNREKVDTSYENLLTTLEGTSLLKFDDEIKGNTLVAAYQSKTFQDEIQLTDKDILIVGDRFKVLDYAVHSGVKLIILTGNHDFPQELIDVARENKINIILSKHNSFETMNLVILSNYIKSININTKPITVNIKDYRTDFISLANKIGHTNYPIVNNKNECLGLLKITSADDYVKQSVVLVDHNAMSQSAIGIEEADIVEVIDHHNLGALGTNGPINFRSMPVGCTCTILYSMFVERKVEIPKSIAGIMLSAILSDTMIFKSPTTTESDKEAAQSLATIAGVDIQDYGYKMFKAASSIEGISVGDLIKQDFKAYNVGTEQLAISQVFTMDFEEIEANIDEYINKLDEISSSYICVVLFITDVYQNGSYVIYNRNAEEIVQDAYDLKDVHEGVYIDNLVSRKKQMLPALLEVIEKRV